MAERSDAKGTQPDLLTANDVAERLSVSVRTLWRLVKQNQIPQPVRYNRKLIRWRRVDIEEYVRGLPGSLFEATQS